jgi:hypothetical protein
METFASLKSQEKLVRILVVTGSKNKRKQLSLFESVADEGHRILIAPGPSQL